MLCYVTAPSELWTRLEKSPTRFPTDYFAAGVTHLQFLIRICFCLSRVRNWFFSFTLRLKLNIFLVHLWTLTYKQEVDVIYWCAALPNNLFWGSKLCSLLRKILYFVYITRTLDYVSLSAVHKFCDPFSCKCCRALKTALLISDWNVLTIITALYPVHTAQPDATKRSRRVASGGVNWALYFM